MLLAFLHAIAAARPHATGALLPAGMSHDAALSACKAQWDAAVNNFPMALGHGDPFGRYRGDDCLSTTGTFGEPKILFVHVGKTGGSEVSAALLKNEDLLKRSEWTKVHMHPVRTSLLNHAGFCSNIIISVRDPVDRFVSAFNTEICFNDTNVGSSIEERVEICESRKYLDGTQDAGHRTQAKVSGDMQHPHTGDEDDGSSDPVQSCNFSSIGAFSDQLDDETDCGGIARAMLSSPAPMVTKGTMQTPTRNHVGRGLCYYLGGVLDQLKAENRSVHLVHTPTMDANIEAIPGWIGINPYKWVETKNLTRSAQGLGNAVAPHHDDPVSATERALLRKHLAPEYALYDELLASFLPARPPPSPTPTP
jgi:hypothetical protein